MAFTDPICSHVTLIFICFVFATLETFLSASRLVRQFKGKVKSFENIIAGIFIQFLWENISEPGNKGGACDTSPGVTHERVPSYLSHAMVMVQGDDNDGV